MCGIAPADLTWEILVELSRKSWFSIETESVCVCVTAWMYACVCFLPSGTSDHSV